MERPGERGRGTNEGDESVRVRVIENVRNVGTNIEVTIKRQLVIVRLRKTVATITLVSHVP